MACSRLRLVLVLATAGCNSGGIVALDLGTDAARAACLGATAGFPQFEKVTLDSSYRAEGVGVLDVDGDGHLDVATDQLWYAGPAFTTSHELQTPAAPLDPHVGIYANCFGVFPRDLDADGRTDLIVAPLGLQPMSWYENPGDSTMHFTPHEIVPGGIAGLEAPLFEDLFGDGHPVLVMSDSDPAVLSMAWWEIPSDPTRPWLRHDISPHMYSGAGGFTHGLGVGDVNGDGRRDVLTPSDWFEQTADRDVWLQRPFGAAFPPNLCSQMWTYDFDGDHLADVVCGRPHEVGVSWWQQRPAGTFTSHTIDDTISELHALQLADLDGDGVPELVTGKRWLAHADCSDPGCMDPALLVAYSFTRDAGGAVTFTRHVIDDDSGVGGSFVITDVDGRCGVDIVTANKKGLFFFRRR